MKHLIGMAVMFLMVLGTAAAGQMPAQVTMNGDVAQTAEWDGKAYCS